MSSFLWERFDIQGLKILAFSAKGVSGKGRELHLQYYQNSSYVQGQNILL